jgi:hypothetical protein
MQAACSMGGKRRNFATSLSGAKAWPAIRLSSIGRRMGFAGRAEQGLPPAEAGTGERGPHHLPLLSSREDSHLGKRQLGWDSPRKGRVA